MATAIPVTSLTVDRVNGAPPTWTATVASVTSVAELGEIAQTPTKHPSRTPLPTNTATIVPSATAEPTATDTPQATSSPPLTGNLLPNPSFEQGWYHPSGIPELQIPVHWRFEWEEGGNPLDPDPWNIYVRPEVRVLSPDFLPSFEHQLYIWDGMRTLKIFKREGAVHVRLLTEVALPAGSYEFQIKVYPDMIVDYDKDGNKIWAPDPLSGELCFIVDGSKSDWILPVFGRQNIYRHQFDTSAFSGAVTVGVAFRGRWAILNNGWFVDDWTLYKIQRE